LFLLIDFCALHGDVFASFSSHDATTRLSPFCLENAAFQRSTWRTVPLPERNISAIGPWSRPSGVRLINIPRTLNLFALQLSLGAQDHKQNVFMPFAHHGKMRRR
jgi:hypothetical protein